MSVRTSNFKPGDPSGSAGRNSSVAVVEGALSCEDCHTNKPHTGATLLYHLLNKHLDAIACTTCHAPVYAKCKPTKVYWDWSKAGDTQREPQKDKYSLPNYEWKVDRWDP